jgi:hypothetical protein
MYEGGSSRRQMYKVIASQFVLFAKYYEDDQIIEVETSGTCSARGKEGRWVHSFVRKTWREEITWKT